jgi:cation/acetate symporter
VNVVRDGEAPEHEQLRVARAATFLMGGLAIVLGIVLEGQNIAFMVGLAFAIAASANFPALLMSIYWRGYTTWGAVTSIVVGATSALVLISISPTVMVDVLERDSAIIGLTNPALISMPLAFVSGILVSLLRPEPEAAARWAEAERRIHLGETAPVQPAGLPARAR